MAIPILLGVIYLTTLILYFTRKEWPVKLKLWLVNGHIIFLGLIAIQIILFLTKDLTFRGIIFDRFIFWGLFTSGSLYCALYKGKLFFSKFYFGFYLFYPILALSTYLFDKLLFIVAASPFLVLLNPPKTYYKDNKYEIRKNIQFLGPRYLFLVEKYYLTEKEIGVTEFKGKITGVELLSATADSVIVRMHYENTRELVTIQTDR